MTRFSVRRLSVSLLFALVFLVGLHSEGGAEQAPSVTNRKARQWYELAKACLAKGELAKARHAATRAWETAPIEPCFPVQGEPVPEYAYLFPEGEALRFFYRKRETPLLYVEVTDGSARLVWQARLRHEGSSLDGKNDALSMYLSGLEIEGESGKRPAIDKPLVFFEWHPTVGEIHYGHIAPNTRRTDPRVLTSVSAAQVGKNGIFVPIPGEKVAGSAH